MHITDYINQPRINIKNNYLVLYPPMPKFNILKRLIFLHIRVSKMVPFETSVSNQIRIDIKYLIQFQIKKYLQDIFVKKYNVYGQNVFQTSFELPLNSFHLFYTILSNFCYLMHRLFCVKLIKINVICSIFQSICLMKDTF